MPFVFVPIEATRIDVSEITDVERERLKVTMTHGETLYFTVNLRNGRQHPRLLLDLKYGDGNGLGRNRELHKDLARKFYVKRVYRKPLKRLMIRIHKFADPHYWVSFVGWSPQRVFDELEIEVSMGSDREPGWLGVGRQLKVSYGTYYNDPLTEYLPFTWGDVEKIESITLPATSLAPLSVS